MTSDADFFRLEGNRQFGLKQFEQAINWYSKALDEQRNALVYSNRAQAYLELDRNADAFLDAKEALQLAPDNSKALYRCGLALFRLGRLEFAKEMLEKCAAQKTDKHVEMKLEEIRQILEQRNAIKCANANLDQNKANSAGAIVSTDIWRQLFTFIGPAERPNVGQLNRTIWSTFSNHHFQRGKKRLTRRLVYVRDEKSGEEQLLVKETFGDKFYVVPFAETSPPPNILGLDLCIEARPGKKLLKFLAQNKNFLSHSTLKFECLTNFISIVSEGTRDQFMELFENNHVTAFWGQATNMIDINGNSQTNPRPEQLYNTDTAENYHLNFGEECENINRIAIYGPVANEFNVVRLNFLLAYLQMDCVEESDQLRLLTLDDDWLPTDELQQFRSRLIYRYPSVKLERIQADAEGMLIYLLHVIFKSTNVDNNGFRSKYAVSMQRMPRHNGLQVKEGSPYLLHEVNKLGEVLDWRLHMRNGKECLLLRRCPLEDLEKEYMHPDILFANPKGEEFASRIMVTGIDDEPHPTHCKLREHSPDYPDATNRKSEWQAYFDLNKQNPGLGLTFRELPRFYYFDYIQREWIKRERPFNSLQVFV